MFRRFKNFLHSRNAMFNNVSNNVTFVSNYLNNDIKNPKVNLGQIQAFLNSQKKEIRSIQEMEFQVFSQWGDDGIIQYLISKINIPNKVFIEFGVENYKESNTRFLLINNNWSGLVIDGSEENIKYIKNDIITWAFDIHATNAFITKENINDLIGVFLKKGYPSEIGILSVDIDGNDYWVWKQIDVVNPAIVIVEYNAVFGDKNTWTIPYKPDFYRVNEHNSYQYWGVSLNALCHLAEEKGYYFIGCNSNGNNAYFVRKDKIGDLKPLRCEEGYVKSKFREYIDEHGDRMGGEKRIDLIRGMKIYNTSKEEIEII